MRQKVFQPLFAFILKPYENGHKKTRISGFFHHKQIFIIRIRYLFMDSNFFEIRIQKRPSPAESGSARDERQIQNHPRCHPDSRFDPCT